ncbi:MAG: hypothetical protein GY822_06700 [Deltaproteobacteria bacterium]|nr:hypothetical protein [Deltaproteobacteria bacterium]
MKKVPRPKRKSKAGPSSQKSSTEAKTDDEVRVPSAALRVRPRPEVSVSRTRRPAPTSSVTERMRAYLLGGRVVHFPYPSAWLNYNCSTCDAPCCRGTSLGIARSKELVTLQSVQENLALFAAPRFHGSSMVSVDSPREACWFLDKKDRCRLEKVGGRNAKPAGCRLFPFHRIRLAGDILVVLPDFSCPIEVESPEAQKKAPVDAKDQPNAVSRKKIPRSKVHSHDAICLEMHRVRLPSVGHPTLPRPRDMGWEKAMKLERRIIDALPRHLENTDYLPFATKQQHLTSDALGHISDHEAMVSLDGTIRVFLGAPHPPSPIAVRDLIVLTGVVRLMASQLPRREMPGVLIALNVLLSTYERMRGARRTPRTIISLFEQRLPLLYSLSHLSHRPILQDDTSQKRLLAHFPVLRAPLVAVLDSISLNRTRGVALSLRDILDEQGPLFKAPLTPDAVTLLFGLGQVLMQDGIFVPV